MLTIFNKTDLLSSKGTCSVFMYTFIWKSVDWIWCLNTIGSNHFHFHCHDVLLSASVESIDFEYEQSHFRISCVCVYLLMVYLFRYVHIEQYFYVIVIVIYVLEIEEAPVLLENQYHYYLQQVIFNALIHSRMKGIFQIFVASISSSSFVRKWKVLSNTRQTFKSLKWIARFELIKKFVYISVKAISAIIL